MTLDGARFAAAVTALIGRGLAPGERFAVAVSGGPDSLALLLLAHAAYGSRACALTVDHALRAGSAQETAYVASVCAKLGVEHAALRWEGTKPLANVQAEARAARYRLLGDWCTAHEVRWLATAHHADDQAETLLLRLARGAGLAGLAGVRAKRPMQVDVTLLRPLLAERRDDLAALVAQHSLMPVDDPSNRDDRFDRTHARGLLEQVDWLDAGQVATAAAHLAEAEAALDWTAEFAWRGRAVVGASQVELDAAGLPRELQRRLLLRALVTLDPDAAPRGLEIDRLIAKLESGQAGTLASVKAQGEGDIWYFTPAPPRRSGAVAP